MKLKETSAIVVGGGSGLGAATAEYLSEMGAQVHIIDRAQTEHSPKNVPFFEGDVTDTNSLQKAIKAIVEKSGSPRICVNTAGIVRGARIIGKEGPMDLETFQQVININLVGTFNVMRLVSEYMTKDSPIGEAEERGVIINTTSIAAYEGQIGQAAYSASKGGVASMTLPLARELAKFGVRVLAIAPGLMETPMLAGLPEKAKAQLTASTVFPKRLGKPEEFARLVGHIVENPLFNGEVIRLDGAVRLQ